VRKGIWFRGEYTFCRRLVRENYRYIRKSSKGCWYSPDVLLAREVLPYATYLPIAGGGVGKQLGPNVMIQIYIDATEGRFMHRK